MAVIYRKFYSKIIIKILNFYTRHFAWHELYDYLNLIPRATITI